MLDCEEEAALDVNESEKLFITRDEMIAQGTMLFFAGYDTTSNAMTHLVYNLAANTDCQQILYEEIKQITDYSYESLSQLKYLNAVIKEVLRLCPSTLALLRKTIKDITIQGSISNENYLINNIKLFLFVYLIILPRYQYTCWNSGGCDSICSAPKSRPLDRSRSV